MNSFFILGLATVLWVAVGFSLSFGQDHGGVIGDFSWAFFNHVGFEPGPYGETIPFLAFALFQMMFAMIISIVMMCSACYRRIREVLDEVPDVANCADPISEVSNGDIEFRNVSFSFDRQNIRFSSR